mgnify:CR=1 FL=1
MGLIAAKDWEQSTHKSCSNADKYQPGDRPAAPTALRAVNVLNELACSEGSDIPVQTGNGRDRRWQEVLNSLGILSRRLPF